MEIIDKDEVSGTGRDRLKEELAKEDPKLSDLMHEASPQELAWGKLVGALAECDASGRPSACSNEKIEEIFSKWETEHQDMIPGDGQSKRLNTQQRIVALFHAVSVFEFGDKAYRMIRQMYIKAITNN